MSNNIQHKNNMTTLRTSEMMNNGHEEGKQSLTDNDIFTVIDMYFNRKYIMYAFAKNSFDKFIEDDIRIFLTKSGHIFHEKITKDQDIKYKFKIEDVTIRPPVMGGDGRFMFPADARDNNLTYSAKILAKVTQIQEISDIYTKEIVSEKVIGEPVVNVQIATIPIMVRSKYCSLNLRKNYDNTECDYDPGCYFIVNGSEKVVISQERMCDNKPLVFLRKDSNSQMYVAQVNSVSGTNSGVMQVMTINLRNNGSLTLRAPILNEFPILILFRALGIASDKEIVEYIVHDHEDNEMISRVLKALELSVDDNGLRINTQVDAINYLVKKIRAQRKYSETDRDVRQKQKKAHLEYLIDTSLLPHITGGRIAKAHYIGLMINKLLNCAMGRTKVDDRDSYVNKRVNLVGDLMFELFRQFFRKMLNECDKFYRKRNLRDDQPVNIINSIRPNTIEQGLKAALLTGSWGQKKGVAQVLQRLTYLQAIELFRRIDSPSNDASSSKLTHPRHLHGTQNGMLCCVTGDTEVLMSDGVTRKQIKNITNTDAILTVNPETLEEEISQIHGFFAREPEKILKITTMTGRTIKCTCDHPILINRENNNIWIRADELKINDNMIVKHVQKMQQIESNTNVVIKSINISEQYKHELLEACLVDKSIPQRNLEITARLIGACITDGHIGVNSDGRYYTCTFCVGEETDAFQIQNDIVKLGFGSPMIRQCMSIHHNKKNGKKTVYNTFNICKNGAFAYYMAYMGGFIGKKTTIRRMLPEWLIGANSRIKQEFLSGFQGGDGCRLSIWKENTSYKIRLSPSTQTTLTELRDDTIEYMKTISKMFSDFGIRNNVRAEQFENQYKIYIHFDQSIENLEKYCDIIGYRYCADKQRGSAPVIEYLKYKRFIMETKEKKYCEIIKLYEHNVKPQQIANETGIESYVIKRIIENHNKGHTIKAHCMNIIGYDDFIRQYYIRGDKVLNAIIKIEEVQLETVYDFTTMSDNHSFIANGIIVHNCVETPEHSKVGLVKQLTILGSVTISNISQVPIIKNILGKKIISLTDVHPSVFAVRKYTKVFLNGDWLGVCDEPIKLYNELKQMKYTGTIEATTSIIYDENTNDIKVYCDGGRLYRPLIRVVDNKLLLTKKHIDMISSNKIKSETMVTTWDELMQRNPGMIEYIDSEEQAYAMISPDIPTLDAMREKYETSRKLAVENGKSGVIDKLNRYGEMCFIKYSHCEFHPSLLLGLIATNIPFLNHNQGPRNIFQYAQGKQAMCTYTSNYRYRQDTSMLLYHPEKPLVNTRTSKYMYNDILSPGENAVVAIGCYTGSNQEDSIVFNKSAIERGLFRSTSFNKYVSIIQKNQSTASDEIFMKPRNTKVAGMGAGSHDKISEKGYVPEETTVYNGDYIIGKVTPIQNSPNGMEYKDSSEAYRQHVPGIVDKVYSDIYNVDGYEMKKMRIRSERVPTIGDKFCCYSGEHDILTSFGWIPISSITKDHKVACLVNGTKLEYQNPTEIQSYDYTGQMYVVNSRQVKLRVTPNHRMFTSDRNKTVYEITEARTIYHKRRYYMKNAEEYEPVFDNTPKELKITNGHVTHFVLPRTTDCQEMPLPIAEWLTFMGIWYAEGDCSNKYSVHFAANKPRVKHALTECCEKLTFSITKRVDHVERDCGEQNSWNINNKQLASYMQPLSVGAVNKSLPDWVWYLNQEQCRVLINGMMLGDGHTMKNGTRRYDTSSKKLADDLQKLCLHAGYYANINVKYLAGHEAICKKEGREGELFKSTTDAYRITIVTTQNNPIVNKNIKLDGTQSMDSYENYSGKVYCCTVPNDGIIYVRKDGYPVWCGNSRHG